MATKPDINVWCPKCGAHPGEPCKMPIGHHGARGGAWKTIKSLHKERIPS